MYVRPLLEYNCVVWSPSLMRDIGHNTNWTGPEEVYKESTWLS